MTKGTGTVGVANRALSNEGMFFEPKEYEGYFFATSSKAVTLEVRLENYVTKTVLAKQTIHFAGGDWAMQRRHHVRRHSCWQRSRHCVHSSDQ